MSVERFQSSLPHGSDRISAARSAGVLVISILAPSRERQSAPLSFLAVIIISILAPSRERLADYQKGGRLYEFQSSLPHGSDLRQKQRLYCSQNFNPRSLTGATSRAEYLLRAASNFNPRSLTGATAILSFLDNIYRNFNPRSLTGATLKLTITLLKMWVFQSSLPHGSD